MNCTINTINFDYQSYSNLLHINKKSIEQIFTIWYNNYEKINNEIKECENKLFELYILEQLYDYNIIKASFNTQRYYIFKFYNKCYDIYENIKLITNDLLYLIDKRINLLSYVNNDLFNNYYNNLNERKNYFFNASTSRTTYSLILNMNLLGKDYNLMNKIYFDIMTIHKIDYKLDYSMNKLKKCLENIFDEKIIKDMILYYEEYKYYDIDFIKKGIKYFVRDLLGIYNNEINKLKIK